MNNEISKYKIALKKAANKITELRDRLDAQNSDIAVIGYSCRFPGGANNPEKFWEVLKNGIDTVTEINNTRFSVEEYYSEDMDEPGKMYTKNAAFLDVDINEFDNKHFEISPNEAASIDLQQRLLLEVSWEAMENAGLNIEKLKGSRTGVFIGINSLDYLKVELLSGDVRDINKYSINGTSFNATCGRLSYFYDFKGPAVSYDTACSSSLVALNGAVESLRKNECDMAIVGGVNLVLSPESFIGLSKLHALSREGRCKAFDASADGFGRGEGCGVIILKRLPDAEKENNNLCAVIKSVSIAQDGKSNGFTAPNGLSQKSAIEQALKEADLTPNDIDYVEAHGTGTEIGDFIEIQALSNVFKEKKNNLLVGSVKTNIGHLEGAAGIAGLIKVIMSIEKEKIPPSIHFNNPNPNIDWSKVDVVEKLVEWKKSDNGRKRRAGISSFGFSGTLAHAIIEEPPLEHENSDLEELPYHIMTLSAKNEKSLKEAVINMKNYLEKTKNSINDICYTSNICRSYFNHRFALCAQKKEDFIKNLDEIVNDREKYKVHTLNCKDLKNNKVAFMFTGQGSIYNGVAKNLYDKSKIFRDNLNLCNEKFKEVLGISIIDAMYGEIDKLINDPIYSQPIIFSIEYSLTKVWNSFGIKPSLVIGHSIGEYVAACYAGLFNLDDAIRMIAERSKIMQSVNIDGKMVGILTDEARVLRAIEESKCKNVSIAAINAPNNVTISGLSAEVDLVIKKVQEKAMVFINKLNIMHPYHSMLMEPYSQNYFESIGEVEFSKLGVDFISTIIGKVVDEKTVGNREYWVNHLSKTVRFKDAIETARKMGYDTFIEIGGNATLSGLANQIIDDADTIYLPSLRPGLNEYKQLFDSISALYLHGEEVEWNKLYLNYKKQKVNIPNYAFLRKKFEINLNNNYLKFDNEGDYMIINKETNVTDGVKDDKTIDKIQLELKEIINLISGFEVDEIEVDTNLFSLGFDSLLLMTFKKQIDNKYKLNISLNQFFMELNTLEKISEYIYKNIRDNEIVIENKLIDINNEINTEEIASDSSNVKQIAKLEQEIGERVNNNSTDSLNVIERLFNSQIRIISEQINAISNLTRGEYKNYNNINNKISPIKEVSKSNNKEIVELSNYVKNDKKLDQSKKNNFYVPYKKLDLVETEKIDKLKEKYIKNITEKYTKHTKESKKNIQFYRKVYANNRNVAGFRPLFKEMIYQIVAEKGKGSKIIDIDGNEFIDLTMGFGVNFFGHNPSFVEEALKEELENGMPLGPMGRLAGEVARQINELTGVDRVAFYNSGTEAIMVALRIARAATGRRKVVTFAGSYHGTFDGVLGLPSYSDDSHSAIPLAPGVLPNMVNDLIVLNYNDEKSLEIIRNNADDIAAVLVETVQSRRPDIQPIEFLKKLRKVTEEENIALIFDEVITGFRISAGGAQEKFGVKSDIVTYGKVVGGGMPIGIVAGKDKYLDCIDGGMWSFGDNSVPPCEEHRTFVAGTFSHHPLAMAASNAVLRHIINNKDVIYKDINAKTDNFVRILNSYFKEENIPMNIVNFGSLFRFVLKGDFEIFFYGLVEKGIYIWEGRNCFLSTEHSNEDIERIISAVKQTVNEMKAAGYFGNNTPPESHKDSQITPMSIIQKRLYTQILMDKSDPYNIVSALKIKGKLNIKKVEYAFKELINRHESLRTRLFMEDEELLQEVVKDIDFKVNVIDKEISQDIDELIGKIVTKFDLFKAPLFKVTLIRSSVDEYVLVIVIHHTIADGLSLNILAQEFIQLYSDMEISTPAKQYCNYVQIEHKYLNSDEMKKSEIYWLEKLSGGIKQINLPLDYQRQLVDNYDGNIFKMKIESNIVKGLKNISRRNGSSLYMVLISAFNILLQKISGDQDIIVGTPVSVRDMGGFENCVGMLTNTIVIKNNVNSKYSFKNFLGEVRQNCLEAYSNMYYPLNLLINKLNNTMFNTMFIYENVNERKFKIKDVEFEDYDYNARTVAFDFSLEILEEDGIFNINFKYKTSLFKRETIQRWSKYFESILKQVIEKEEILISDIEIISEEERNKILYDFNDTKKEYASKEKTIHELFEEQVENVPDNVAIIFEDKKLTYKELNEKANFLARILREKGVEPDSIVGIMLEPSLEMIVGIMAILKSGGAYLPIDPEYPEDRVYYTLKDSKAKILLTQSKFEAKIKNEIDICDLNNKSLFNGRSNNLGKIVNKDNLAYVIYTSGTTGTPKGVMIKHSNLINYCSAITQNVNITSEDETALLSSYAFDLGYTTMFTAMTNGITLNILPKEMYMDPTRLIEYLEKSITYIKITPSMFNLIVNCDEVTRIFENSNLRLIILGGELISIKDIEQFKSMDKKNKIKIMNHYGPTESTIGCITTMINTEKLEDFKNVIGKPLNNVKAYILDEDKNILGIGISGELCISGDGLARGYLNNEKLTLEKFVDNPYELGKKMYKTGDLARWLKNGNIEFLGRMDDQVKVSGFRIELGEIESNLLKITGIKEVVVLDADKDGSKYLCAYYVSEKEYKIGELRAELKKYLPNYMIPLYFIKVKNMPLTMNGKINRKLLPKPNGKIDTGRKYEKPRNEMEEKLVEIWEGVLDVNNISINDSYFELGGDSLKATILVGRINKELNIELPLKTIFSAENIKDLSEYILTLNKKKYDEIEIIEEKEYYKASSAQKRLYTIQRFNKNSIAYNMPEMIEITGEFDVTRAKAAIEKLIERHEILRTSFHVQEDEIVQKVNKMEEIEVKIQRIEVSCEEDIKEKIKDFIKPFNLEKAPLFRLAIINLEKDRQIMLFDMHHILSDGTSSAILTREFGKLYGGKELADLPSLRVQYKDYAAWQLKKRESDNFKSQEKYWLNEFRGEIPVLNLPTDYPRPQIKDFSGDNISFFLDKDMTSELKQLAKETGSTLHMVLLANMNVLLSKYSGQEEIIVGNPIAGRNHADLENIIGMFVNTLAIKSTVNSELSFRDYLKGIKEKTLKAYENQDYQFEKLIDKIGINRDLGRNPLFDVMFAFQNLEESKIEVDNLIFNLKDLSSDEKFDITIIAVEENNQICFNLSYATSLYKSETMKRMGRHLLNIIKETVNNIEIKLKEIEVMDEDEKNKLLVEFNNTKVDYSRNKTIHELFEDQVEKTPNNIAAVFNGRELTYKELNERANSLARRLREKGVKADTIVGIMVERSLEMMIGIMATLKAGGAYLPIDPMYSSDRIEYMLEDSNARILLTQSNLMDNVKFDGNVIDLKDVSIYNGIKNNLEKINSSNNLAYVIYTSGSTGKPKGVMLEHRNANNFITGIVNTIEIAEEKNILALTTICFDIFFLEVLLPLTKGLKVIIADSKIQTDANELSKFIYENKIDIIQATPSRIKLLANSKKGLNCLSKIETLLVGGEMLSKSLFDEIRKFKNLKIYNMYGPTETTVWSSIKDLTYGNSITIGKPISNTSIYIVNKNNKLQPIGVAGELCIAGDGVARGYLNRAELTEEKFIDNPFEAEKKMYKTGDLAKWLPDGEIEILGRLDYQVKIRGFRIELGEIESSLMKIESVKEAVVLDKDKGGIKYLCAYYVAERECSISELRRGLKKSLPDYMIPSYFIKLEKMPLTPNGKMDRKSLPEPNFEANTGIEYEAPRNESEKRLVKIWESVLGIKNIGINDNFFELGGNSLNATIVVGRIHRELNVEVPLKELFIKGNIRDLSEYVLEAENVIYEAIPKVEEKRYYEASSAQKRMYLLQEANKWSTAYNMSSAIEIIGDLDFNKLKFALESIIQRHEILRTTFDIVDGTIVQKINKFEELNFNVERIQVSSDYEIRSIYENFIQPFDLRNEILLRVKVINLREERNVVLIDIHHIISDGTTIEIMKAELNKIYLGEKLENLQIQYKDYSEWQKRRKESLIYKKQEEYWLKEFQEEAPELNIPTDYERTEQRNFDGDNVHIDIDEETTKALNKIAKETNSTMFMTLLSCVNILLSKYSGQEDIIVGSPIAGRNHSDLENMLGMFVNTLAIRTTVNGKQSLHKYIGSVRDKVLQDYANQDYQFEDLISSMQLKRKTNRNPIFDIMFVFQNVAEYKSPHGSLKFKEYIDIKNDQKFDISIVAKDLNGSIGVDLQYSTSLFKRETIEEMKEHFIEIIQYAVKDPEIKINDINLTQNYEKVKKVQYDTDFNF